MDGGRFYGGGKVEVERLDVFDFKLVLTEEEFSDVKYIAVNLNMSIEDVIARIFCYGIDCLIDL